MTPDTLHLTSLLVDLRPDLAGRSAVLVPVGKPRTFTYSRLTLLDLVIDGQPVERLALKEPFGDHATTPAAEFAALQTLAAHFAGVPDLDVVRPILALDNPPGLVMTAAQGERLQTLLTACRRPVNADRLELAAQAAGQTGRWLAHLHRLHLPVGMRPAASVLERFDNAAGSLGELGVGNRSLMAMRNLILELSGPAIPEPVVALHGDFTPRNVLCRPGPIVTVLDTDLSQAGPPAYDLGWFLASLEFLDRWQLYSSGRIYDRSAMDRVRSAFLSGYTSAGAAVPTTHTLASHTAARLVQRWAQYASHLQTGQPRAARLLLRSRVHPFFSSTVNRVLAAANRG